MSLLPEISQASAEINKLVAQANIHQTIAPVDPAAFTDPADTMLLASRDPVIREVSVGMTGVEAVQNTVSGTPPLFLPNSLGKPLKAWSVDLLPYQEGTGDPAPDNVRPIHGTNTLTITTAGDNLCGGITMANEIQAAIPTAVIDTTAKTVSYRYNEVQTGETLIVFPWKASTQYTFIMTMFNVAGRSNFLINYTDNSYDILYLSANIKETVVFATDSGKTIKNISKSTNDGTVTFYYDECGIFEGVLTADQFEPYVGASNFLTLPQTVYTGTIGSEGGESRWGEVDLGTLNWSASSPSSHVFRSNSLQGRILAPSSSVIVTNAICEQFSAMAYGPISQNDNGKFAVVGIENPAAGRIVFIDNRWDSIDDFVTAISGVKLVYPLINPTTFAVTSPTIPTPTGTATTWATAEDGTVESMEVTYYKSE